VDNFNDVDRHRYGGFAQWEGEFAERWDLEAGIRYTRILMDAGKVDASPARVLPPAIRLRKAFNAADRSQSEDLIDAVVKLGVEVVPSLKFELGLGRKTRAPSYLERYAWLPLEVTGGLGDGNNYVGDLDLDHEVSYEVEGGFEWRNDRIYLAPRAYYRQVDDYIQGVLSTDMDVIMVSSMNGDTSPLVYSNVEAEFYGFDVAYGIDLPCRLEFEGTLGWVRGKRRDTHDDLYRIAPLHGRSTLTYRREFWSVSLESVYAARQSHVSAENSEKKTGAYGIANVFGSWEVSKGVVLDFGIENVFDKSYGDHLAGVNRVSNSAVKKGGRIPGLGRSVFGRLTGRF
jgi:iron complex outermembrane receptor protein